MTTHDKLKRLVRHLKRGTSYEVIGQALLQSGAPIGEAADLTIYRSLSDGRLWARPTAEFDDGRFEELRSSMIPTQETTPLSQRFAALMERRRRLKDTVPYDWNANGRLRDEMVAILYDNAAAILAAFRAQEAAEAAEVESAAREPFNADRVAKSVAALATEWFNGHKPSDTVTLAGAIARRLRRFRVLDDRVSAYEAIGRAVCERGKTIDDAALFRACRDPDTGRMTAQIREPSDQIDIEAERRAFEQWFDAPRKLERDADGRYKYMAAHSVWTAWRARAERGNR